MSLSERDQTILYRLEIPDLKPDESRSVCCPSHPDTRPSLSVTWSAENDKLLLYCHAGADCTYDRILEALGVEKHEPQHVVASYRYTDEDGALLYTIERYAPQKKFKGRGPDGTLGLKGVRRVLYNLPAVGKAIANGEPVFVLEGEKDVNSLIPRGFTATTSPFGAKNWDPAFADSLTGADVIIVPDNDDDGRLYANSVGESLTGKASSVKVLTLPDLPEKGDVSDFLDLHGVGRFRECIETAVPWEPLPVIECSQLVHIGTHVKQSSHNYWVTRVGRNNNLYDVDLSNFVMKLVRRIALNGDNARLVLEVIIHDQRHLIEASLFTNTSNFQKWCASRGLQWLGTTADLAGVFSILMEADVPTLYGVDVVGLHGQDPLTHRGGSFVFPIETIGEQGRYGFVAPAIGDVWTKKIALLRSDSHTAWSLEVLPKLIELHSADVMTVILGWMAAAPLRSLFSHFPPLLVTGASGNGKTTLVQMVLLVFGWNPTAWSAFGCTPHSVTGLAASSNAIPVWFDEFRADTPPLTRTAIEQVIRDAWDGAATIKGGSNRDNVIELTGHNICAPIIVTGEDSFSQTSHLERSVLINLPSAGRNAEALDRLFDIENDTGWLLHPWQGFGRTYLEWLRDYIDAGMLPPVPNLLDRPKQARAVPRFGYDLLETFIAMHDPDVALPPFDDSRITRDQIEALSESPFELAIEEAMNVTDEQGKPICWKQDDGMTYLRTGAMDSWIRKFRPDLKLPGGAPAIVSYVKDHFGAESHNHKDYRRTWRWETVPTLPEEA